MATLTVTTTAAEDARIIVAFGRRLRLFDGNGVARSATAAEVKADVIAYVKNVVLEEERAAAKETASAGVSAIAPT